MLYVMARGHDGYRDGCDPLIFLGVVLGDVIDANATWCVSDANAAAAYSRFSRDVPTLGSFVDFDLLRQRDWSNTQEDGNRKSRRAAELLVLKEVSISLVSLVVARSDAMLARARAVLGSVSGTCEYRTVPKLYY